MDCLHIEIRIEETLAIDYCHPRLSSFWQPQLQPHKLYDVWFLSVHFGLTTKSVLSAGLVPLMGSEVIIYNVYLQLIFKLNTSLKIFL